MNRNEDTYLHMALVKHVGLSKAQSILEDANLFEAKNIGSPVNNDKAFGELVAKYKKAKKTAKYTVKRKPGRPKKVKPDETVSALKWVDQKNLI